MEHQQTRSEDRGCCHPAWPQCAHQLGTQHRSASAWAGHSTAGQAGGCTSTSEDTEAEAAGGWGWVHYVARPARRCSVGRRTTATTQQQQPINNLHSPARGTAQSPDNHGEYQIRERGSYRPSDL